MNASVRAIMTVLTTFNGFFVIERDAVFGLHQHLRHLGRQQINRMPRTIKPMAKFAVRGWAGVDRYWRNWRC
jgi:hypothetical protein